MRDPFAASVSPAGRVWFHRRCKTERREIAAARMSCTSAHRVKKTAQLKERSIDPPPRGPRATEGAVRLHQSKMPSRFVLEEKGERACLHDGSRTRARARTVHGWRQHAMREVPLERALGASASGVVVLADGSTGPSHR